MANERSSAPYPENIGTAIVGGSGLTQLSYLSGEQIEVNTPFGAPSAPFTLGEHNGEALVFLQRHGLNHQIAPHNVNYRANIWALKKLGVRRIIAVAATGGIPPELFAGAIVIPHQLIDYTYGREHTFLAEPDAPVQHIDFTYPYTESVRAHLIACAANAKVPVVPEGVYAATQGPRLETAAEIDRLDRDGATIVGMTGMPEAALARELEIDYACLSLVVNPAAGRADGPIALDDLRQVMASGMVSVTSILQQL